MAGESVLFCLPAFLLPLLLDFIVLTSAGVRQSRLRQRSLVDQSERRKETQSFKISRQETPSWISPRSLRRSISEIVSSNPAVGVEII